MEEGPLRIGVWMHVVSRLAIAVSQRNPCSGPLSFIGD
jgi:hypothetical protein